MTFHVFFSLSRLRVLGCLSILVLSWSLMLAAGSSFKPAPSPTHVLLLSFKHFLAFWQSNLLRDHQRLLPALKFLVSQGCAELADLQGIPKTSWGVDPPTFKSTGAMHI